MKLNLPRYTSKDLTVLKIVLLPMTVAVNLVIFGKAYFTDLTVFLFSTLVTAFLLALNFSLCSTVAVIMKRRFPAEAQLGVRLCLMIVCFLILNAITLLTLFRGYETLPFLGYTFDSSHYLWAFIGMAITNVFFTFLHEGIARYESWRANLHETEAVKKVYRQSRLMGLKSQVNPHFLFNSLNSLSCLIQEDQEKGEKFLDEMTKVYRYMLQNDEEQFVTLDTELKFIQSYLYLLRARHGDALNIIIDISEEDKHKLLPPLALQTVVENILSQNAITRDQPLDISIYTEVDGAIAIGNNVQRRSIPENPDAEKGLNNLVRKYELLGQPPVIILGNATERIIRLPLVTSKEEVTV
jgi:two-component system, LytTR family, sensor kinase